MAFNNIFRVRMTVDYDVAHKIVEELHNQLYVFLQESNITVFPYEYTDGVRKANIVVTLIAREVGTYADHHGHLHLVCGGMREKEHATVDTHRCQPVRIYCDGTLLSGRSSMG